MGPALIARWHVVVNVLARAQDTVRERPPTGRTRLVVLLATGIFLALGLEWLILGAIQLGMGLDFHIYQDRAADFVAGRGFYLARQLAGPYLIQNGDSLYPPPSLLLFVPFLWLPAFIWWVIPIAIILGVVVYYRPSLWVWPLLTLCMVAGTGFANTFIKGNPTMWIGAAVALSTLWRPIGVLVFVKPTFFPFGLLGIRRRDWWLALGILGLVSLAFLPMWPDYFRVIADARGRGWEYTLSENTVCLFPLIAWWARTRGQGPGQHRTERQHQ